MLSKAHGRLFDTEQSRAPIHRMMRAMADVEVALTVNGIAVVLLSAGIFGTAGWALYGGTRTGLLVASIAIAFIGALVGPIIATQLGLAEPLTLRLGGRPFPIVWPALGALVSVSLFYLFSRRPAYS